MYLTMQALAHVIGRVWQRSTRREFPTAWDSTSQIRVLGPRRLPLTVHRLTMHIITLGDATMVLCRMCASTFDIKGPPSPDTMLPKVDGHLPCQATQFASQSPLNNSAVQGYPTVILCSQAKMSSSCCSLSRLITASAVDLTKSQGWKGRGSDRHRLPSFFNLSCLASCNMSVKHFSVNDGFVVFLH